MVDNINTNFQLTKEMLERLSTSKEMSCGLFADSTALNTAYPSPTVGMWALVGKESPFAIYRCSTDGTWADTGETYTSEIDLTGYVTEEEFDPIADIVLGGDVEVTEDIEVLNGIVANTNYTGYWLTDNTLDYRVGDKLLGVYVSSTGSASSDKCYLRIVNNSAVRIDSIDLGSPSTSETYVDLSARNIIIQEGDVIIMQCLPYKSMATENRFARYNDKGALIGYNNAYGYTMKIKVQRTHAERTGSILERMTADEKAISAATELAQEAYDLASQQDEPTHDVYKRDGEDELSATPTSAKLGAAVYTTLFSEDKTFNTVIVRGVKASAACTAQWRVYAYPNTSTNMADYLPPSGNIGNSHTLLSSGTVVIGTESKDLVIELQGKVTCPADNQVIVYLVCETATLSLGIPMTPVTDTHYTYTCNLEDTWTAWWSRGAEIYKVCAPVLRYESSVITRQTVEEMIEEALEDIDIKTPEWKIVLPDTIHVLVGGEINLWNDGISLPLDNGLKSPLNYSVQWTSSMDGVIRRNSRGVCIRPTQTGAFTLTCRMYTNDGELLIDEKTIKIVAVAKNALNSAKNIVCIGSSSCPGTTHYIDEILSDTARYTGTRPTFWGTLTEQGTKHEGHGGWKWSQFWGSASPGGVTNPLYDPSVGHASASYYRNTLGMGSAKFDLVFFQLGLNDFIQLIGPTPKTVAEYRSAYTMQLSVLPAMKSLIEEFLADNPDCKIILALPYICNNSGGHSTAATYASLEFAKASYAMRLEYLSFLETHPSVILSAGHQMIDRWYGFVMDSYMTSASSYRAYQQTDIRPHDIIHCGAVGYRQYAEGFVASIIAALGTTSETETSCGYDTGDVIASNVNPASPSVSAVDQTARDAAAAAQTTANMANTTANAASTTANAAQTTANEANAKKAVVQFDSILDGTTPTPMEGDETVNCSIVVYAEGDKRFYGKTSSASSSFYAKWNGYNNYVDTTNSNKPHGDRVYRCADNGVSYIFAEDELQRIDDGAYSLASAALPASAIWSGTQAQYDALSAAQKAAVIAFIEEEE